MSRISNILSKLSAAVYAIDVRDDIVEAIRECYENVNNPTLQTDALQTAIQHKIDSGAMAAMTIGDGTITKAKLDPNISLGMVATVNEDTECLVLANAE